MGHGSQLLPRETCLVSLGEVSHTALASLSTPLVYLGRRAQKMVASQRKRVYKWAGRQAGRQAGKLVARQAGGGGAEKQAGRKNFVVLLERVRFTFCTITFAYVRPACRLSRRNLEKVRPPSKVS